MLLSYCSAVIDPQILELSGIGQREVLEKIGVDVKIELPGVGENVQDHTVFPAIYELDPKMEHITTDLVRDPAAIAKAIKLQYIVLSICETHAELSQCRRPRASIRNLVDVELLPALVCHFRWRC